MGLSRPVSVLVPRLLELRLTEFLYLYATSIKVSVIYDRKSPKSSSGLSDGGGRGLFSHCDTLIPHSPVRVFGLKGWWEIKYPVFTTSGTR